MHIEAFQRDPETWYDGARDWVLGQLVHIEHYLSTRRDEYSDIGKRYNSLLPPTVPLIPLGR